MIGLQISAFSIKMSNTYEHILAPSIGPQIWCVLKMSSMQCVLIFMKLEFVFRRQRGLQHYQRLYTKTSEISAD